MPPHGTDLPRWDGMLENLHLYGCRLVLVIRKEWQDGFMAGLVLPPHGVECGVHEPFLKFRDAQTVLLAADAGCWPTERFSLKDPLFYEDIEK